MPNQKLQLLSLLCLLLLSGSCATKSPSATAFKYHIKGRIEDSQDGDTLLLGVLGNPRRINKAVIRDSKFEFKGVAPELSIAFIQYRHTFELTGKFVLEKKPIVIEARVKPEDPDYAAGKVVKGGMQNQYVLELNQLQAPGYKELGQASTKISQAQKEGNTEEVKQYQIKNKEAWEKLRLIREQYAKVHPDALIALYEVSSDFKFNGFEKNLTILNSFDDQIKKTSLWARWRNSVELEAKR